MGIVSQQVKLAPYGNAIMGRLSQHGVGRSDPDVTHRIEPSWSLGIPACGLFPEGANDMALADTYYSVVLCSINAGPPWQLGSINYVALCSVDIRAVQLTFSVS